MLRALLQAPTKFERSVAGRRLATAVLVMLFPAVVFLTDALNVMAYPRLVVTILVWLFIAMLTAANYLLLRSWGAPILLAGVGVVALIALAVFLGTPSGRDLFAQVTHIWSLSSF